MRIGEYLVGRRSGSASGMSVYMSSSNRMWLEGVAAELTEQLDGFVPWWGRYMTTFRRVFLIFVLFAYLLVVLRMTAVVEPDQRLLFVVVLSLVGGFAVPMALERVFDWAVGDFEIVAEGERSSVNRKLTASVAVIGLVASLVTLLSVFL